MENLESQLFLICLVLALTAVIIFVYKVMLSALGGPDKREKKKRAKKKEEKQEPVPTRGVIRREEAPEEVNGK